jgi:hypothetical protein
MIVIVLLGRRQIQISSKLEVSPQLRVLALSPLAYPSIRLGVPLYCPARTVSPGTCTAQDQRYCTVFLSSSYSGLALLAWLDLRRLD